MYKCLLFIVCACGILLSCSNDDEEITEPTVCPPPFAARTVIVYMMAENNLTLNAMQNIREMMTGSKMLDDNTNLIAFVDQADQTETPYIIRIAGGTQERDKDFKCNTDFYASDPEYMKDILTWIMNKYQSGSYGLVLWGHAGGWIIENDTIPQTAHTNKPQRAYGWDTGTDHGGNGIKWINIPTLAKVLEQLPHKLDFIFADCCNFQNAETAYELRNATDYIIASPAEIPAKGAPYSTIVPKLFSMSNDYHADIAREYNATLYGNNRVPMSVVKTSEMDNLALATREVMEFMPKYGEVNMDGVIYYRTYHGADRTKIMPDANDLIWTNIGDNDTYKRWKDALDKAVIYKAGSSRWTTDFPIYFDFDANGERYGGISMFIPLPDYENLPTYNNGTYHYDYNRIISQMKWYHAAGVDNYYTGNTKNEDAHKVL